MRTILNTGSHSTVAPKGLADEPQGNVDHALDIDGRSLQSLGGVIDHGSLVAHLQADDGTGNVGDGDRGLCPVSRRVRRRNLDDVQTFLGEHVLDAEGAIRANADWRTRNRNGCPGLGLSAHGDLLGHDGRIDLGFGDRQDRRLGVERQSELRLATLPETLVTVKAMV